MTACGGGTAPGGGPPTSTQSKPSRTFEGPAGLLAAAQPEPNGFMWLLAKSHGTANLQQLNLTTGKIEQTVPEPPSANSVSQSTSGVIGVGTGTATIGALELRNGSSGSLVASVPIGAPVKDVFAGADGSTFYVLNGNSTSMSTTLVNSQTDRTSVSVPVPLDTVAIAVDPNGRDLFAVGSGGKADEITIGSGTVAASFAVGKNPIQLSVSTNGSTLYVLKSMGPVANVGVIRIATESQSGVLTAPANCVDIQLSSDGQQLYDIVGTPEYGNIQVFPVTH